LTKSYTPNNIKLENLEPFEAITGNQQKAMEYWDKEYNLILSGSAGTGKTFLAMNLALEEVLIVRLYMINLLLYDLLSQHVI